MRLVSHKQKSFNVIKSIPWDSGEKGLVEDGTFFHLLIVLMGMQFELCKAATHAYF